MNKKNKSGNYLLINPIPAGGGGQFDLPVVFFYKTKKVLV